MTLACCLTLLPFLLSALLEMVDVRVWACAPSAAAQDPYWFACERFSKSARQEAFSFAAANMVRLQTLNTAIAFTVDATVSVTAEVTGDVTVASFSFPPQPYGGRTVGLAAIVPMPGAWQLTTRLHV